MPALERWLAGWIRGPNAGTKEERQNAKIIAVLAGGLGEPHRSLNALRTMLWEQHQLPSVVGATFMPDTWPPYPYARMKEVGEACLANVLRLLDEHPGAQLTLVGHSQGGIVMLYVAHQLHQMCLGHRLKRVFLLGAPVFGVNPRFLFLDTALAQKIAGHRINFMNRQLIVLANRLLQDIPCEKIVAIYSNADRFVWRFQATIPGAKNIRVNRGHLLMIASAEVAKHIRENI